MEKYYFKNGISIYNCDNLELLRALPSDSINLIYCDVLYNTGKQFDDYNDNLGSPQEAIEWYRPRMIEMRRVLTENGSIFIHCNWRLDSYIRILMDEVFGGDCFRNRIYRKHSDDKRGFYSNFDSQMDIILYYVKDKKNFVFHEVFSTRDQTFPLFENGYMDGRSETRRFIDKTRGIDTEINLAQQNKHWLVSEAQYLQLMNQGEVVIINGLPYRFSKAVPIGNLWDTPDMLDKYDRTATATAYDTPKPEAILERIITMCSNHGDVVADFFLGGGITAVVAKRLGRYGIFCDISKKACDVTISKLENK